MEGKGREKEERKKEGKKGKSSAVVVVVVVCVRVCATMPSILLPNLSNLSIDAKTKFSEMERRSAEREKNEDAKRSKLESFYAMKTLDAKNVDFRRLFEYRRSIKKRGESGEYKLVVGSNNYPQNKPAPRTLTFTLRPMDGGALSDTVLTIESNSKFGSQYPCVVSYLEPIAKEFKLDSLFYLTEYALSESEEDQVFSGCEVVPTFNDKNGLGSGSGDMVINFLKYLGSVFQLDLALDDGSNVRGELKGNDFVGTLGFKTALSILRGYGYYQPRGFMEKRIVNIIYKEFGDDYDEFITELLLLHQELQLAWTHFCVTTPIFQLKAKIPGFYKTASAILAKMPSGGSSLMRIRFADYTLKYHSEVTLKDAFTEFETALSRLEADNPDSVASKHGLDSFTHLSMRGLARMLSVDKSIFQDAKDFSQLSIHIGLLYSKVVNRVGGYDITPTELKCPVRKIDSVPHYVGIQPPASPGLPPTSVWKPLDSEFSIEFESNYGQMLGL